MDSMNGLHSIQKRQLKGRMFEACVLPRLHSTFGAVLEPLIVTETVQVCPYMTLDCLMILRLTHLSGVVSCQQSIGCPL